MKELIINLSAISPITLWGSTNQNFSIFKKHFPKLRLVARGEELKILGDAKDIKDFQSSFNIILSHLDEFNELNPETLEHLLTNNSEDEKNNITTEQNYSKQTQKSKSKLSGGEPIVFGPNGLIARAKTPNQQKMVTEIEDNDILFAVGPAGTGKTYTAVALAVRALKNKEVKRIILTRPAVEAGENLGFLPGDLKEKVDPYLRPLYDALQDMIPGAKLTGYLESGIIEVAPLAFMRGRTLDNCFVILDEAQNATEVQLKMFLTRMGPSAKFIVNGDMTQIDLPKKHQSGLKTAIAILNNIKGISIVHLDESDVVRHALVKRILKAYGDV